MIQRIELETRLKREGYKYIDGEMYFIYGGVKMMNRNKFYRYLSFSTKDFIESKDINSVKVNPQSIYLYETENEAYTSKRPYSSKLYGDPIEFLSEEEQRELCEEIAEKFIKDIQQPMNNSAVLAQLKELLTNKGVYDSYTGNTIRGVIKSLYGEYVSICTPLKEGKTHETDYKLIVTPIQYSDCCIKRISLKTVFSPSFNLNLISDGYRKTLEDITSGSYTHYIGLDEEYIKEASNLNADISYSLKYDNDKEYNILNIQFEFKDDYTSITLLTLLRIANCLKIHTDKFDNLYGFEAISSRIHRSYDDLVGPGLYVCTEYKDNFIKGGYWTDALCPFKSGKYLERFKPIHKKYIWDETLDCYMDVNSKDSE